MIWTNTHPHTHMHSDMHTHTSRVYDQIPAWSYACKNIRITFMCTHDLPPRVRIYQLPPECGEQTSICRHCCHHRFSVQNWRHNTSGTRLQGSNHLPYFSHVVCTCSNTPGSAPECCRLDAQPHVQSIYTVSADDHRQCDPTISCSVLLEG